MTSSGDSNSNFDTTGQLPPPGTEKRPVTTTPWEDEGTLLFHVVANGVTVARREDNHMINGSKLLDVSSLSQERKDELLNTQMVKHIIIKAPSEYLLGTWITFDQALNLANQERITENLYPLFVHNIGALRDYPANWILAPISIPQKMEPTRM